MQQPIHPGNRMDEPEPLIAQYNLRDWCNPNYDATDINNFCRPPVKTTYKGIVRFGSNPIQDLNPSEPEEPNE